MNQPHKPRITPRLYRSRDNRMIAGVAGGLAEYFGMDPTFMRLIFILLVLLPGISVLAYLVAWIIIPEAPADNVLTSSTQPVSEPGRRQTLGAVLVVIGLVYLVNNFGWLHIDAWTLIWRFWPLAIIYAGLQFFILNPIARLIIVISLISAAAWLTSYVPVATHHQTLDEDSRQAERIKFKLDLGAADINFKAGNIKDKAYTATFQNIGQVNERVSRQGSELSIELNQNGLDVLPNLSNRRANLTLNRDLPLELEIEAGASQTDLDFSGLKLERLKADIGASSGKLTFGDTANLSAAIEAGASSLTLRVPKSVGLRLKADSSLSAQNFSTNELIKSADDTYESPEFSNQNHQVIINLEAGASSINLERY